jgi:tetratricopeptide (TPR) repeat protein
MDYKFPPPLPFRFAWIWILLLVGMVFLAKPAFRMAKDWRAQFFLKEAQQAWSKGDYHRAQEKSRLCLQLSPKQIEAVRMLARIADLKRDSSALEYWMFVVQSNDVIDADRIALIEAALRENAIVLADQQMAQLLKNPSPSKEVCNLAGLIASRKQQKAQAHEWFSKALEIDSGFTRAELNLARTELFLSGNREMEAKGLQRLRVLGSRSDEWGIESLRMLVAWSKEHPKRLPYNKEISESLRKHPLSGMADQCVVADWEIQAFPNRRDSLVSFLTASISKLPPSSQKDLAAWLNRHGLFKRTLEVFPLDQEASEELILVQLDAFAALGNWQGVSDFLERNPPNLSPVLKSLYLARSSRELGNERLFTLGWRQAMREAQENPKALRYLGEYAQHLGELSLSVEAYETLSQIEGYQPESLLKLVRLYEKIGQTRELFRTIQRLYLLLPNDPAILNDLSYLGLLLNDSSTDPLSNARQVYGLNPNLPAFATTYALAQLRAGLPAVSLSVYEHFSLQQLTAPGWQAVYSATLAANGRKAEAMKVVEKIDLKSLKPEERQLISDFLPRKK